jgi:hypothetical protein
VVLERELRFFYAQVTGVGILTCGGPAGYW